MVREIYVVGDKSRLVVKNLVEEIKKTGIMIQFCEPDVERLKYLPTKRIHLVFCVSDEMEFEVEVKNTGSVKGQQVVLVFVSKPQGVLGNPARIPE